MSNHDHVLELSLEAYDDLVNIQNYTYKFHGEKQWRKYSQDLDHGMQHIMNHPQSGHKRDDLPSGYLSWPVQEHVLIYRIQDKIIYLVRILHNRMDFRFQF